MEGSFGEIEFFKVNNDYPPQFGIRREWGKAR